MIATLLARQIIQLFIMMFCGFLMVRMKLLKASDSKTLSILVVYIICPCTVLNAFQIRYTPEIAGNFLLAAGAALLVHLVLYLMTLAMKKAFRLSDIERVSIMYSNAGNLVIPLVSAILGEEWVVYASAFMVVQLFIIWTHGKSLVEGKRGADLKSILTNVNLIACVIGLTMFLLHMQLPGIVRDTVKSLGSTVGPVGMLMIGMILGGLDLKAMVMDRRVWFVSFLKMIVSPLIILLVLKYSGLASLSADGQTILYISLLATMTPVASTVTQMAQLYDKDVRYATALNTITTLVCIGTMPLLTMLYYL